MANIVVENATKKFGKFVAIDDVSISINDQEFVVLLGPSGCGKTTLLRAIAGLGMVDSGRILIDGKDVTYISPRDREISMVFQNYAIFPHIKVFDNIAFGLKMKKMPPNQIRERVQEAAELLHIEGLLDRYPGAMSGGQRQRVAVARAIAYESKVLLMDEPLSNLDALLRLEMRAELKSLLNKLDVTTIYVTHDQIEALSMGDRIAVMKQGRILQYDHPTMVYDKPSEMFVGSFIGNPPMNFFKAHVQKQAGQLQVKVGDLYITPPEEMIQPLNRYEGKFIYMGIRAENMEALNQHEPNTLSVHVDVVEPLGSQNLLTISVDGERLKVSTHPDFHVQVDDNISIRLPIQKLRWIAPDTQHAIAPDLSQVAV